MYAAVAQLAVVQAGLLRHLAGLLCHACHLLAQLLALGDLLQDDVGHVGVLVEVVIDLFLDEVANELVDADTAFGLRRGAAELHLRLALEERLLYVDADGSHHAVADVGILVVLAAVVLDDLGDVLLEGSLMRAAKGRVLAIDEGVVLLTVLLRMGEGYLDVIATEVDDGIERLVVHAVGKEVGESVARHDAATVEHDGQPRVEVSVVAEHQFHELAPESIVLEEGSIGLEEDGCAVLVLRCLRHVALKDAFTEDSLACLSVAEALHLEACAQGIHSLEADTVQADTLLESLRVVLAARIEHRDGLHELAQGNASAIVADADAQVILYIYLYALAGTHLELIDAVVDDFLEEHVDAVLCL